MASESCAICGDEVDENEIDPCGHFDVSNDACADCGESEDEHTDPDFPVDHAYVSHD